jgi:hypothetical protein
MVNTKEDAPKVYRHFTEAYGEKHPKAVECLWKHEEAA